MKARTSIDKDRLVHFACQMVRAPSVLGREGEVAQLVRREMENIGYDKVSTDFLGNVVGSVEGTSPGPTLLLDGHMDTVDVHPRASWSRPPFSGQVDGGKIHGRGSSDMKGALAAMIHAAASLDKDTLQGRVIVSATVGEESIEGEALRPVVSQYSPDYVIIGEASDLRIVRAGRGRAEFEVVTNGKPAHASTPELGVNAILQMIQLIGEIQRIHPPSHASVGKGVLCLTDIISTPYPAHSVVPSLCRVTYERRLVPGESRRSVLEDLRNAARKVGVGETPIHLVKASYETYTGERLEKEKWFPAWELPKDHPLVRRAIDALSEVGIGRQLSSYQFCTNAAFTAGEASIPTIGFGPSREGLAHIIDEYVEIDSLLKAAEGYRAIAEHLLC